MSVLSPSCSVMNSKLKVRTYYLQCHIFVSTLLLLHPVPSIEQAKHANNNEDEEHHDFECSFRIDVFQILLLNWCPHGVCDRPILSDFSLKNGVSFLILSRGLHDNISRLGIEFEYDFVGVLAVSGLVCLRVQELDPGEVAIHLSALGVQFLVVHEDVSQFLDLLVLFLPDLLCNLDLHLQLDFFLHVHFSQSFLHLSLNEFPDVHLLDLLVHLLLDFCFDFSPEFFTKCFFPCGLSVVGVLFCFVCRC